MRTVSSAVAKRWSLAHALFEADLIDEVGVNIQPVLLGSGIRFFSRQPSSATSS